MDANCSNPRRFQYQELVRATNNFSEKGKLGKGATGSVFKGTLNELSCVVAVKRVVFGSRHGMESYLPEVKILDKLKHENLVSLIGWSCNKKELLIAYEYVGNRTLEYHLFKETDFLTWVADPRLGLSYDENEMEKLIDVGLSCANPNPDDRPTTRELIKMLKY
ncbi:hypothetical protein SADUNF_Sadunf16G0028000 [Salix dunnii]|uniref:Protein kinase domain-containing protein n=1 Tax=Salix dunnii TaxID=1413687 RepID=A0A835J7L9_9ROSI|nr:hypothetical protein SADUNF_Sadunf16G0028000 [Salix dunnii]